MILILSSLLLFCVYNWANFIVNKIILFLKMQVILKMQVYGYRCIDKEKPWMTKGIIRELGIYYHK